MEDYKVTARFVDGTTSIYDALDCGVARSVYYGFVKDEACVEVSYRLSPVIFDRLSEAGRFKADVERFTASEK